MTQTNTLPTGYQIFLMVELGRLYCQIDKDLEYDETWERATELYMNFVNSEFNDAREPEYEAIENFLMDLNK